MLSTIIDFNICNIHSILDRWNIIVEQNVRFRGSTHPVKFLSRGRDGGLRRPAGLLLLKSGPKILKFENVTNFVLTFSSVIDKSIQHRSTLISNQTLKAGLDPQYMRLAPQ